MVGFNSCLLNADKEGLLKYIPHYLKHKKSRGLHSSELKACKSANYIGSRDQKKSNTDPTTTKN